MPGTQAISYNSLPQSPQCWFFGVQFKNKQHRRLAEKFGYDWENNAMGVTCALSGIIQARVGYGVSVDFRSVRYHDKSTTIASLCEDDERKRRDESVTEERIDRLRRELELPEGTKPKWYEETGSFYDPDVSEDSDDDEPIPEATMRKLFPDPSF